MALDPLPWEISETARMIRRAYDRRAASLGVTSAQWRVLLSLEREGNLRQVELADRLDVEPITLCRILDRLGDAGLVERHADPADRRAWRLALTDKAGPILNGLHALATDLRAEAFEGLESSQMEMIRTGLAQIRDNVSRIDTSPTRVSA